MAKPVVSHAILRQMHEPARVFRKNPTPGERKLWAVLRDRRLDDVKLRRQKPFGPFVVDSLCAAHLLVIEVDGPIHETQPTRRDGSMMRNGNTYSKRAAIMCYASLPTKSRIVCRTCAPRFASPFETVLPLPTPWRGGRGVRFAASPPQNSRR